MNIKQYFQRKKYNHQKVYKIIEYIDVLNKEKPFFVYITDYCSFFMKETSLQITDYYLYQYLLDKDQYLVKDLKDDKYLYIWKYEQNQAILIDLITDSNLYKEFNDKYQAIKILLSL